MAAEAWSLYCLAKLCKIRINEFGVTGIGPNYYKMAKKAKQNLYARLIPLGGFS